MSPLDSIIFSNSRIYVSPAVTVLLLYTVVFGPAVPPAGTKCNVNAVADADLLQKYVTDTTFPSVPEDT
jgi:hypothetical protein